MRALEKGIRCIANFLAFFSIISTAGMMLISVADVIMRKIFNSPIVGASELVTMLNVGTILALGLGCLAGDNISVDFVMNKFPKKLQHVVQIMINLITIVIFGLIIWRGILAAMDSKSKNYVFSMLKVPQWPFILVMVLSFVGGILAVVWMEIREIGLLTGKLPKELEEGKEGEG